MQYKLVNKTSKEVVDTTEQTEKNLAWTYFYLRKQIPDRDDFNRLFEVVESKNDGNRPTRFKHEEVEDKLPNLLILHYNMGNFPIRLITGNSEKMKEIVRETCEVQGFVIDDTWNTNHGTMIIRS